jgi:hypothetical protein
MISKTGRFGRIPAWKNTGIWITWIYLEYWLKSNGYHLDYL